MSLELLKGIAAKRIVDESDPHWVSDKNASAKAYSVILSLKKDRLNFIENHYRAKDYKKKRNYQISASEVARLSGVSTPTLISTSSYSTDVKEFLSVVNQELYDLKEKRVATYKKSRQGGVSQRRKDELKVELVTALQELDVVKSRNAHEQISTLLKHMPLPIKRKLGLDI